MGVLQEVKTCSLHDRTGRLEMCLTMNALKRLLHDRTGRLEIYPQRLISVLLLHDRTGRLEKAQSLQLA